MKNDTTVETDGGFGAGLVQFLLKFGTDAACREYLEAHRWPGGPECGHCESGNVYKLEGKTTRAGLYKCAVCRKPFTVTMGTIFEGSHIPLPKWFAAIYLMCSSKKGISAHQIHRTLKITYKSAWFMCHRIRHAMKNPNFTRTLTGTVEVDETYVGGKAHGKVGRGADKKTPVVALIQRDGPMATRVVKRVTGKALKGAIRENVYPDATIMTDQFASYRAIGKEFAGGHKTVNHGAGEYVNGDAHVNTAESFFALFKRGVHGTFHHVNPSHLHRYTGEFEFRWNNRKVSDGARTEAAINGISGVRLMYKTLISRS